MTTITRTYPGHAHNMTEADRVHLHEKITLYFEDWLKKFP